MMKYAVLLVALMLGLAPGIGLGALVGDPAPPLNVSQWMTGKPVVIKPGTNIFVVAILHVSVPEGQAIVTNLNNLQDHFKTNGVVVVGVSDEGFEKITKFVQGYGTNNFNFAMAADRQRFTSTTYLKPVLQRVIPYVFVVDTNGNLLWHGLPHRGLGEALTEITQGRYDEKAAQKRDLAMHQMGQYLAVVRQGGDRADMAGRALLAARTNDVTQLCEMAYNIATAPQMSKNGFALASQALDLAEKLPTTNTARVMVTRAVVLFESGKRNDGLSLATQALASAQSPEDKSKIESCLHTMQSRMEEIKARKAGQSGTNILKAARSSGTNANQDKASPPGQSQDSVNKP